MQCGATSEGALDLQFIQKRFDKGKSWATEFTTSRHQYLAAPLPAAQGEILQWQRAQSGGHGSDGQVFKLLLMAFTARLTIMVLDLSLWPSRDLSQTRLSTRCVGPMVIDEAIECSKAVLNGSDTSCMLVLMPLAHGSTDSKTTVKNRRLAEDKCMALLGQHGVYFSLVRSLRVLEYVEVNLMFRDGQHGGDRRKRLQSCLLCTGSIHRQPAFSRSRAALGALGPADRARVCELVSDDPERAASPPYRATWLPYCG